MAELNVGKLTQIVSAVIDIKFPEGKLPEIIRRRSTNHYMQMHRRLAKKF